MKLKDYIEYLQQMSKDDPTILELDVISSCDEEGNSYFKVSEYPIKGVYEKGQFCFDGMLEEEGYTQEDINAITLS